MMQPGSHGHGHRYGVGAHRHPTYRFHIGVENFEHRLSDDPGPLATHRRLPCIQIPRRPEPGTKRVGAVGEQGMSAKMIYQGPSGHAVIVLPAPLI